MRTARFRNQVVEQRGVDFPEQVLAVHDLKHRAVTFKDVDLLAPGLSLDHGATQNVFAAAAPEAQLDAILVLENLLQGRDAGHLHRRIEHQPAFRLRARQQGRFALGAAQARQLFAFGLRLCAADGDDDDECRRDVCET